MKTIFYSIIACICIISCATTANKDISLSDNTKDTIRIANDSLEYEIIIIEPGFNAWLVWVLQPQRFNPNLYMQQINYEPNIRYGYEVNYLLFNYFQFFEQRYRQRFFISRGSNRRF